MKKILYIRNIVISIIAFSILIWAFFKYELIIKIIIVPFFICTFSLLVNNIFLLLNKEFKIYNYIYQGTIFTYIFGFLLYILYYSIAYQNYFLVIIDIIFLIVAIYFLRLVLKKK